LDLVRPTLLRRLIALRNAIEHDHKGPPSIEEAQVMLDSLWYFLRSTDAVVKREFTNISVYPEDHEDYWLEFRLLKRTDWKFKVDGWIPAESVSADPPGNLEVKLDEFRRRAELGEPTVVGDGRARKVEDAFIAGRLVGPTEGIRDVASMLLTLP